MSCENLRALRAEYLFLLARFCSVTDPGSLPLNDFALYIDGIDKWLELLPKLAAAGQMI